MLRPILHAFVCGLLALCLASPALAQYGGGGEGGGSQGESTGKKKGKRSWGRSADSGEWGEEKPQEMGARLTKKYLAGYELYSEDQFDAAIKLLSAIRMTRLNPYEKA